MTLYKLTNASIKMYIRNKQALFWSLFFPMVIMVVFGLINFEGAGTFNVGVINRSPSPASKDFIEQLKEIPTLKIFEQSKNEERKTLDKGDRDIVLILPENFLNNPQPLSPPSATPPLIQPTKIEILTNQGRPQQASAAVSILQQVFSQIENQITQKPKIFTLETKNVDAHNFRYIDFLVPGVMALSIMQLGIFSIAFAIVNYKEKGVMKRLFAAPLKSTDFILSQVFTRLLVSVIQISILITVATIFFDLKIIGNYFILLVLVVMGSILFLCFGFALGGFAKTQDAAAAVANIFVFPQMFLGNVFFPLDSMPAWLQKIVVYLPLNYLADGIRQVAIQDATWSELQKDFMGLIIWIGIAMFAALKLFRWRKIVNQ